MDVDETYTENELPSLTAPCFMNPYLVIRDVSFHALLTLWLKMMFVSGETGDPPPETTGIIEEIVREQVIGIVR